MYMQSLQVLIKYFWAVVIKLVWRFFLIFFQFILFSGTIGNQ